MSSIRDSKSKLSDLLIEKSRSAPESISHYFYSLKHCHSVARTSNDGREIHVLDTQAQINIAEGQKQRVILKSKGHVRAALSRGREIAFTSSRALSIAARSQVE